LDDTDEEVVKRFEREVRIQSKLDHPNIVKVLDKKLTDDARFYVMPLYRGSLVDEFPDIVGYEERLSRIYSSILDAIEHAHTQGAIHRDLKPENVLLNSDQDIVISDFGRSTGTT
jgi:eukaryotic-like serine/threonine-protein kinase